MSVDHVHELRRRHRLNGQPLSGGVGGLADAFVYEEWVPASDGLECADLDDSACLCRVTGVGEDVPGVVVGGGVPEEVDHDAAEEWWV